MATRQERWDEDAEEIHNLLAWIHWNVRQMANVEFYEITNYGVFFFVGLEWSPVGQTFLSYEQLDSMKERNNLNLRRT